MPDDISSQWKELTPEQRDQALGRMSPEQKQKLATSLGYKAGPQPEARTFGNYAKEGVEGVGRGIVNDVKGLASLRHPIDTAKQVLDQDQTATADAAKEFRETSAAPLYQRAGAAASTYLEENPFTGSMVQHAEQGGTKMGSPEAFGAAAEGVATIEAPKIAGKGVGAVLKSVPRVGRALTGTGTGVAKALGEDTAKENEASARDAKTANDRATETTLRKRGAVDEKNAQRAAEDAKSATDNSEERRKAIAANRKTEAGHSQSVEETKAKNAAAVREQGKIEPTQEKLNTASQEMRARVETARQKALQVGNEKYGTVNEALSEIPADMEKVGSIYANAAESFGEAQSQPAIVTRLGKALEKGEPMSYADLQKMYSELGKELSKGTLPGTTYHAYDLMHEAIGEDMQRIADSQGQGAALTDARNYWRRMKQTFGKPYNPTDAATGTFEKTSPEFAAQEEQANRLRLLSSFDPEIGKVADHIENLRKGLKALGPKKPLRDLLSQYPDSPARKPIPPASSTATTRPPVPYREPEPTTPHTVTKIGAKDIQNAKLTSLNNAVDKGTSRGMWLATWPLFYGLKDVIRGNIGDLPGIAGESAATGAAVYAIGKFLKSPKVAEFLTKARPQDVAQIPPDLRGDMAGIVEQAGKRGIKVSPALTTAFGVGALTGQKPVAKALTAP